MNKLALFIWTLIPRKVGQSLFLNDNSYIFDFVWFGKHFKGSIQKKK